MQKAPEQGREGLQPCRRQLPVALTHQPAWAAQELCKQTDIFCISFQPTLPPQLCDNFLQFIFLKSSITKKPEQCQKWRLGFEFLCHPLVPNVPPSPCLFSKLKNRNFKSSCDSCDPCQVISNLKSNICQQKSSIFSPLQCPQHWQHQGQLPNEQLLLAAKQTRTQCWNCTS